MVFREVEVTVFTCETRFFEKNLWVSLAQLRIQYPWLKSVLIEYRENGVCNFVWTFVTGKKRGATVRLSNVTINAPSVLKHEEELESLAVIMPADSDARRKWVNDHS